MSNDSARETADALSFLMPRQKRFLVAVYQCMVERQAEALPATERFIDVSSIAAKLKVPADQARADAHSIPEGYIFGGFSASQQRYEVTLLPLGRVVAFQVIENQQKDRKAKRRKVWSTVLKAVWGLLVSIGVGVSIKLATVAIDKANNAAATPSSAPTTAASRPAP